MKMMLVSLVVLAACSSSSSTSAPATAADGTSLVHGFTVAAPQSGVIQVVSAPITAVPPGADTEYCYFSKLIPETDTVIKATQSMQSIGVHHVAAYWTTRVQPEQVRPCTEDDMASFQLLGGGGGGESANGVVSTLPDGTAFKVHAGGQIVVNTHIINVGKTAIDAQGAVNLILGDPSLQTLQMLYFTNTSFSIPPRATQTASASCPVPHDLQVIRVLGHMHQWGTHNQLTAGDKVLYDKPGAGDFAFNPPPVDFPLATPYVIKSGDKVEAQCTWNNTTDQAMTFPTEMCAGLLFVLGDTKDLGCADGQWGVSN
jgi:hypothetical protein